MHSLCIAAPRRNCSADRRRSLPALTQAERKDISRGIACGSPLREIARRLDRAVSTVSREALRHGGRSAYRAHQADDRAWDSALPPKKCLLALHQRLCDIVASKLILDWSPEQISGWLKTQYPDDESMRVSHETIYRSSFIQARGVLKKRADGPSAFEATHAPLATGKRQRTVARTDRRCHLDPGKTGRGRRPSDSWPLGRGSASQG